MRKLCHNEGVDIRCRLLVTETGTGNKSYTIHDWIKGRLMEFLVRYHIPKLLGPFFEHIDNVLGQCSTEMQFVGEVDEIVTWILLLKETSLIYSVLKLCANEITGVFGEGCEAIVERHIGGFC